MANPEWTEPGDWDKPSKLQVPQSGRSRRQAYGNGRGSGSSEGYDTRGPILVQQK